MSPQLGLEPTKMRQDLKKSMIISGCAYCQSRVENIRFQIVFWPLSNKICTIYVIYTGINPHYRLQKYFKREKGKNAITLQFAVSFKCICGVNAFIHSYNVFALRNSICSQDIISSFHSIIQRKLRKFLVKFERKLLFQYLAIGLIAFCKWTQRNRKEDKS